MVRANLSREIETLLQAGPVSVTVERYEERRSTDQNARLWAQLTDVSEQVDWYGKRLSKEEWKDVFTAALRQLKVVPNLDGTGFVVIGASTSRMSKKTMADLLTLIDAFGAEHGVVWSEPEREEAA